MNEKRIFLSPPHLSAGTAQTVCDVLASNYVAYPGQYITQFEQMMRDYTGAGHAAATACGTAALHLSLLSLGIGPGDIVLTSDFTFVGSANPIAYCGAQPVFIDSEPRTWNMDPALLREAVDKYIKLGKRPKAVLLVHIYGLPADLDPIVEICREYDIPLIEDASEALGTFYKGRHVGNDGIIGAYSFNGNKMITTGGGGMVVSADKARIDAMVHLATQARDPAPYYLHTKRGYNYRMSNILAGVGVSQMRALEERVLARRTIFSHYRERIGRLEGVSMMPDCEGFARPSYWLSCIRLDRSFGLGRPEIIRQALERENIETRRTCKPMHTQPLFKDCPVFGGSFDVELFDYGLCLPSGSAMSVEDLDRVCDALERAIEGMSSAPKLLHISAVPPAPSSASKRAHAAISVNKAEHPAERSAIREKVEQELAWALGHPRPIAILSCSAREGAPFSVTPRRKALGFDCIGFMFSDASALGEVLPLLDGKLEALLVDVEEKKPLNLLKAVTELAPHSRIVPCKPNDATVEGADQLLLRKLGRNLSGKSIAIAGTGNLGSKLALRLAERGASVSMFSRNVEKCRELASALSLILPTYCTGSLNAVGSAHELPAGQSDALISCASARGVIGSDQLAFLRDNALVIDAGIDNFRPDFFEEAARRRLECYRLDTRIGFPYLLMQLLDYFDHFFGKVCASTTWDNIHIVSGGCLGPRGSVIVDNCSAPTQIIGLANGTGGILREGEASEAELAILSYARTHVGQTS